jgi:Asp-tRNA(Asn)/Glu-tRNA(Gln) amidotransferase A subunit family amidase
VSRAGAMSLAWSMDKLGPIARSVEDCVLVFDAIHGVDPRDPTAIEAPFTWQPTENLKGQRIGVVSSLTEEAGDWQAANQEVVATLRRLGAEIVPIALPNVPLATLRTILDVECAAAFDELTLSGMVDELNPPRPSRWAVPFRTARFIPAVEYIQANRLRTVVVRTLEQTLEQAGVDVWVTPPFDANLTMTNLTGHPAVCVPTGFMPVKELPAVSPRRTAGAVTFNARLYRDDRALAVAHAYQQATDWHLRRPPIA